MRLADHERARLRTREHPPTSDRSQLARGLQPFWNAALGFVPARVAPNTLTVLGSLAVVVPTGLALSFSPTLTTRLPAWLIVLQIAGVFVFQTLDALDGKQARRTGASSPLGSWLDHALDIVTMQLVLVGVCASVQAGTGVATWATLAGTLLNNYLLHWESSHTRALILGNGTSITEAQVMAMLVHAVALISPTLWISPLSELLPAAAALPLADAPLSSWMLVISVVTVGGAGAGASMVRALKSDVTLTESVRRAACIVVLLVPATLAWFGLDAPPLRMLLGGAALLVGARSVGRVVLENLLSRPPSTLDPSVVMVALALVGALLLPAHAFLFGLASVTMAVASLLSFFVRTARLLADVLDERVFSLPATAAAAKG